MNREEIFRETLDYYLKPLAAERADPAVTEIMINGPGETAPCEVYLERNGVVAKSEVRFHDREQLLALVRNVAQYTGKRVTPITSRFDSRLPDGSRVHVVMPRCSPQKRLYISIRKFSKKAFSLAGLCESGSLSEEAREYLEMVVDLEKNIIVSGGTGSGKTTFLNAISRRIPATERIIVIEDTSELQLQQPHVVSMETVPPDRNGQGTVTIGDLFHSALRMRPDRIVIGECRRGEALDLIQAMTSGHGGSMSTLHANNATDALNRLETMALMSGVEMPLHALRAQIASAIHLVVQLARLPDGRRVVAGITEVGGLTPQDRYEFNKLFERSGGEGSTLAPSGNKSLFSGEVRLMELTGRVTLNRGLFGIE